MVAFLEYYRVDFLVFSNIYKFFYVYIIIILYFKKKVVWLNPELIRPEWASWTRKIISSIIPIFDLTIEGIEEAMDYLRKGGKNMYTTVQLLKGLNY